MLRQMHVAVLLVVSQVELRLVRVGVAHRV